MSHCLTCAASYVDVSATILQKGLDQTVMVQTCTDEAGNIKQIALPSGYLEADRVIFNHHGWVVPKMRHRMDTGSTQQVALFCCEATQQWRLPRYVDRDDMDPDQPIIMLIGRWLGTRGTVARMGRSDTYLIELRLSPQRTQTLSGMSRNSFGYTFKDDDPRNLESVLPRALRYAVGELVWVDSYHDGQPVICRIEYNGHDTNGNEIRFAKSLAGEVRWNVGDVVRPLTPSERAEFLAGLLDD